MGRGSSVRQRAKGRNIANAANGGIATVNDYSTVYNFEPLVIDEAALQRAEALLATLPLDAVLEPSPLPQNSCIPYTHNPHFVGRDADLKELARALKAGTTTAVVAATGIGGVGKSQLAVEFAHRYGRFFTGGVFWLSFAQPDSIPAQIADFGGCGALDLRPDFSSLKLTDQVRLVQEAWQNALPRLLVFDNCEDQKLLEQWRPKTGRSHVLLTSRIASWPSALNMRTLPLDVLTPEQSLEFLLEYRPDLVGNTDELNAIADELGYLPLALYVAGNYLSSYEVVPSNYLMELRKVSLEHSSMKGRGSNHHPTGHELNVEKTFAISFDMLNAANPTDQAALELLACAAHFAPGEPIPCDLLLATFLPEFLDREREDIATDPEGALLGKDALKRLINLGLIQQEAGNTLKLHRLLAAFVQKRGTPNGPKEAVERVLLQRTKQLLDAGYPEPLLALGQHLRYVINSSLIREDETSAGLCSSMGRHLHQVADYKGARVFYERAFAIREKVLGPDHSDTAWSLNDIGMLLHTETKYQLARPYLERALAIQEKALGSEHPDTAWSLTNMGALLRKQGLYKEARECLERALAIREKVLGPEHPNTAWSLDNIGLLLHKMRDYKGARPYYERALAIREKVLGPEHRSTAWSLNSMGNLLYNEGYLEEARPYYEQALAIREKVLGPEHSETKRCRLGLKHLQQRQKRLRQCSTSTPSR